EIGDQADRHPGAPRPRLRRLEARLREPLEEDVETDIGSPLAPQARDTGRVRSSVIRAPVAPMLQPAVGPALQVMEDLEDRVVLHRRTRLRPPCLEPAA